MRTTAEINQVSTFVYSGAGTIGNLGLDDLFLERVPGEEFKGFFLGDNKPMKLLLLFRNLLNLLLNRSVCDYGGSKIRYKKNNSRDEQDKNPEM
jgi:hypothetical protein